MAAFIPRLLWTVVALGTLTVELDLKDALRKRRTTREIQGMTDHVIVRGAGRNGRQAAQELEAAGKVYVIIERNPNRIAHRHRRPSQSGGEFIFNPSALTRVGARRRNHRPRG